MMKLNEYHHDEGYQAASFLRHWLAQPAYQHLKFGRIISDQDQLQLKQLRLKVYAQQLPYMLNQILHDGNDAFDPHSFIFGIWHNNILAASIRLTPYPYESQQFISEEELTNFLGLHWQKYFLEWSRLIVDASLHLPKLVPAITTYAGLYALTYTSYTHYFGYTRKPMRRILSNFQLDEETLNFTIANRGPHPYWLLKGSFLKDFQYLKQQFKD